MTSFETPDDLQSPDWQPVLEGGTLTLRPLRADDFERLYAAAADPLIWALHPESTRYQRPVFQRFFDSGLACGGALLAIERASGAVVGSSRYYQWRADTREVTVGYTFLVRRLWGGQANAEMKRLMLDHAFRWAETAWFEVGRDNLRSRRAMEKIGGRFSHEEVLPAGSTASPRVFYRIDRRAPA